MCEHKSRSRPTNENLECQNKPFLYSMHPLPGLRTLVEASMGGLARPRVGRGVPRARPSIFSTRGSWRHAVARGLWVPLRGAAVPATDTDAPPRSYLFCLRSSMSDPAYMQALKGEFGMMKYGWFRNYHAKYMVQGRFKPAIHLITFVMCLGYVMEYPHLKCACSRMHRVAHGISTRAARLLWTAAHRSPVEAKRSLPRCARASGGRRRAPSPLSSSLKLTLCPHPRARRREARLQAQVGARCDRGQGPPLDCWTAAYIDHVARSAGGGTYFEARGSRA